MPIEKQMSEIFSRKKFYEFQEQVMSMVTSSANFVSESAEEKTYIVSVIEKRVETEQRVVIRKDFKFTNCFCQMFEFE